MHRSSWLFLWWLILPYNVLILLISAIYPPFFGWYLARMRFEHRQTHERLFFGFLLSPAAKYIMHMSSDILIAFLFTTQDLMPATKSGDGCLNVPHRLPVFGTRGAKDCAVFGSDIHFGFARIYMYVHVIAAFIAEVLNLLVVLFHGAEPEKLWGNVVLAIAGAFDDSMTDLSKSARVEIADISKIADISTDISKIADISKSARVEGTRFAAAGLAEIGRLGSARRLARAGIGTSGGEPQSSGHESDASTEARSA